MAVSYEPGRKRPWKVELYEGSKRMRRSYCRTKAEAEALDKAWHTEKATGLRLVVDNRQSPTFKDFVEGVWLEHYKKGTEIPTWEKRLSELRWHVYPVFGKRRLSDVTAGHILDLQARMKGLVKPNGMALGSQTIRNVRSAVSIVFEYAKSCTLVASNPVRLLGREQTRLPVDKPAMTVWTNAEVELFLLHLAKVDFQAYVAYQTLIQTGMRPGEMRGIRRDQVNFETGLVDVRRHFSQREKKVVDRCKHGSERVFEMPPVLVKILRRFCDGLVPEDRLFPFVTNNFLWRKRQKWMRAAGVRVIRNHDFRHTVAAAIYRAGMKRGDPEIVPKIARMMGHKKLAQTYHYLEGLMKNDKPSDAATHLSWGDIEDDFIVAAAARMASKIGASPAGESSAPVPEIAASVGEPYPIPIGRPRKRAPQNSPSIHPQIAQNSSSAEKKLNPAKHL